MRENVLFPLTSVFLLFRDVCVLVIFLHNCRCKCRKQEGEHWLPVLASPWWKNATIIAKGPPWALLSGSGHTPKIVCNRTYEYWPLQPLAVHPRRGLNLQRHKRFYPLKEVSGGHVNVEVFVPNRNPAHEWLLCPGFKTLNLCDQLLGGVSCPLKARQEVYFRSSLLLRMQGWHAFEHIAKAG